LSGISFPEANEAAPALGDWDKNSDTSGSPEGGKAKSSEQHVYASIFDEKAKVLTGAAE